MPLSLHKLFQIQLPLLVSSSRQKILNPIRLRRIQDTHNDPEAEKISHMSFIPWTLFQLLNLLRLRPPVDLGVQHDSQETLAP